jgi:hypothetical protein
VHDDHARIFHGFAKITRDITQLKQDQERLETRDRQPRHRARRTCSRACACSEPTSGSMLCNDRVLDIFGISREQSRREGTAFADLFEPHGRIETGRASAS